MALGFHPEKRKKKEKKNNNKHQDNFSGTICRQMKSLSRCQVNSATLAGNSTEFKTMLLPINF